MIKVLFVCLGNICRSPMAEAVFRKMVRDQGLEDQIFCDSAGTGHWHIGELPHIGTRQILEKHHVPCNHRSRLLTTKDLREFDLVIPMDADNHFDILEMGGDADQTFLLMSFAPKSEAESVPDPYYTGDFDSVYRLVNEGCAGLLNYIQENML